MLINRRPIKEGLFHFDNIGRIMMGFGHILDGLVDILSGGMLYGDFAYQMMWRVMLVRSENYRRMKFKK